MAKKRVFISFDFDNDKGLRNDLVKQSRYPDSPFSMVDKSVQHEQGVDWKKKVRKSIKESNLVIFICGQYTNNAKGVQVELSITKDENKPYFLLRGHRGLTCMRPLGAGKSEKMYKWDWPNLKRLIAGDRW